MSCGEGCPCIPWLSTMSCCAWVVAIGCSCATAPSREVMNDWGSPIMLIKCASTSCCGTPISISVGITARNSCFFTASDNGVAPVSLA